MREGPGQTRIQRRKRKPASIVIDPAQYKDIGIKRIDHGQGRTDRRGIAPRDFCQKLARTCLFQTRVPEGKRHPLGLRGKRQDQCNEGKRGRSSQAVASGKAPPGASFCLRRI